MLNFEDEAKKSGACESIEEIRKAEPNTIQRIRLCALYNRLDALKQEWEEDGEENRGFILVFGAKGGNIEICRWAREKLIMNHEWSEEMRAEMEKYARAGLVLFGERCEGTLRAAMEWKE